MLKHVKHIANNSMILKATKPLQYVCLFPADIPTEKEGDVFIFMFVDAHSGFVFKPLIERDREPDTVLKNISALLQNPDFIKQNTNGFTIVLHKYNSIIDQANALVKPYKGKVIINDAYVIQIVMPLLKQMFTHMSMNNKKP